MITTRRVKGRKVYHVHKSVHQAIERYVDVCDALAEDCPPAVQHARHARKSAEALKEMIEALNERHTTTDESET